MNSISQDNVFCSEVLENSIHTDWQVHRWFLCLVLNGEARRFLETEQQAKKYCQLLQKMSFFSSFLYVLLLLSSTLFVMTRSPACLGVILLGLGGLIYIFGQSKDAVVFLSHKLVNKDFPPEKLGQTTLYQMGEYYARQYAVPSMVDVICAQDYLQRKAILFIIVVGFFYKIPVLLSSLLVAWLVILIIHWPFIYKNLK